jgi:hypothetical protein
LPDGPAKGKDIVRVAKDNQQSLRACNVEKAALRAYYDQLCKGLRNKCSDELTFLDD